MTRRYYSALDMLDAGMRIVAIADTRPEYRHDLDAANTLRSRGVLILPNHTMVRAEGTRDRHRRYRRRNGTQRRDGQTSGSSTATPSP